MSKKRTFTLRAAATAIGAPAGILAIALAGGCKQESDSVGMEGEPPPEMEESEGMDPSGAGEGEDPYAEGEDPHGTTDPAGEPPAMAEGGEQPGMGGAPSDEPITDEQLDSFAEAYLEVEDVQQELEAELHAAESNEEAQAIQQKAMTEIRDAVEETGMDFETYGLIAQRLQQDPELVERVEQTIEQKRN